MSETLQERSQRYAEALWRSDQEAGYCSTPWPLTPVLEQKLLSAGAAAAGVIAGEASGKAAEACRDMAAQMTDTDFRRLVNQWGLLGHG